MQEQALQAGLFAPGACWPRDRRTFRRLRPDGRCAAACTRIWWVRPVSMWTSQKLWPPRRSISLKWLIEGLPFGFDPDHVARRPGAAERSSGASTVIVPRGMRPDQQGQVALVRCFLVFAFAHQGLQFEQGRALLGDDQHAGGIAIEPMHQFQRFAGPQGAQALDHAKADAAAAVAAMPLGLFSASRRLVLEDDAGGQALEHATSAACAASPDSSSRTGGIRISSPPEMRESGLARLPLIRTWPLRTSL